MLSFVLETIEYAIFENAKGGEDSMTFSSSSALISIIIPIGPALTDLDNIETSLTLNNNLGNVEFILVMDSVTPELCKIIRKLPEKCHINNCKILKVNFGNPGQTRNAGIEASSGNWVQFWDSDDVGDLNLFLETLTTSESDVVVQQYRQKQIETEIECTSETRNLLQLVRNPGIWRIAMKREILASIRFPGLSMAEDQVFIFDVLAKKPSISFNSTLTYTYFVGSKFQLTSQKPKMKDLPISMSLISHHDFKQDRPMREVQILFLEKLLVTSLKHAGFHTFITCTNKFLKYVAGNFSPRFLSDFLNANFRWAYSLER